MNISGVSRPSASQGIDFKFIISDKDSDTDLLEESISDAKIQLPGEIKVSFSDLSLYPELSVSLVSRYEFLEEFLMECTELPIIETL